MSDIFGHTGSLLRVDLTTGRTTIEPSRSYIDRFLGGRGLGQALLFEELDPSVEPLGPGNKVVFSAGPLVGTLAPTACRLSVDAKSPQSGGVGSSNAGGSFAPELKFAGFDALVVEGQAGRPVWIFVSEGRAEIRDAADLWGATVRETEARLRASVGDPRLRVACIGPAGENLVHGACVMVDAGRAAARCGLGTVLGSKKLKAIAVRGTGGVRVANPTALEHATHRYLARLEASPAAQGLKQGGTHLSFGTGASARIRLTSVRNNQGESWPSEKVAGISEPVFKERFELRRMACFNCPLYCSHYYRVPSGPYEGTETEGIQANTVRAFGPHLDIDDPAALVRAQSLCNDLGLDVDAVAALLGWAFECYQRGALSLSETGGLELTWGNHQAALALIEQIAHRQGLGELLALGVRAAAATLGRGSDAWALHVRGADMNEGGVRASKTHAFGIAVSQHAGGHLDGSCKVPAWGITPDVGDRLFGVPTAGDPKAYFGQGRLTLWFQKMKAAVDALGLCYLCSWWLDAEMPGLEDYSALLSAATGQPVGAPELLEIGERIHALEKAFNTLHAGFLRADDTVPARFFEPSRIGGDTAGAFLDRTGWSELLSAYYRLQGWDEATGWQTAECLDRLGLSDLADKLGRHGRLATLTPGGEARTD